MASRKTKFIPVKASLADMAGAAYVEAVAAGRSELTGESRRKLATDAKRKVDFFPAALHRRLVSMLPKVGRKFSKPLKKSSGGAGTAAFNAASKAAPAPLSALGYYRLGETGRLHLITKSEHYHTPLGHSFPGYNLIDTARRLGIPNATHNNTRGNITRRAEEDIVRVAAGLGRSDRRGLSKLIASKSSTALNRVLNLETGSLAVEAAVKMMLARFWRESESSPRPKYAGRVPVFIVIGDEDGALAGNYHGTTVITQMMRGMWPGMLSALEKQGVMKVRTVKPNDKGGLEAAFRKWDRGRHKIAGMLHEIIMMNYGAKVLTKSFIRRAHALCAKNDVPTLVDEIQSCVWSPELYTFREYGLKPTFVSLGKGFPGGEFAASRILFNGRIDTLSQFGALVTNGQEELASLAYLVTIKWAEANARVTRAVGDYLEERLGDLASEFPERIVAVEGSRHLAGLHFCDLDSARDFTGRLVEAGLDISVQTYKASCPPAALVKLPLIMGYEGVDCVIAKMRAALEDMDR